MPNQHKTPLLGWHPPAELGKWVRDEAERRGVPISVILNEAVAAARDAALAAYRKRTEARGKRDMTGTVNPPSLQTQAFRQAGAMVFESSRWPGGESETLEETARRFIRSRNPRMITGSNGESFAWMFSDEDIPAIAAAAGDLAAALRLPPGEAEL